MKFMSDSAKPKCPAWALTAVAAAFTGLLRVVPHPWNFSSAGALCLYCGARLPLLPALAVPFAVMYVTDLILWQSFEFRPFVWIVYGCFLFTTLLGMSLRRTNSPWKIGAAAVTSDIVFFFVTNFAAWRELIGTPYPDSLAGLGQAYVAALPFFQWSLLSSLVFVPVLFGAHALATRPAAEPAIAGQGEVIDGRARTGLGD